MKRRYRRKTTDSYVYASVFTALLIVISVALMFRLILIGSSGRVEVQAAYVTTQEEQVADGREDIFQRLIASLDPARIITSQFPSVSGVDMEDIPVLSPQEIEADENKPDPDASDEIKIQINNIKDEAPDPIQHAPGAPSVLIYHTHYSEAFDLSGSRNRGLQDKRYQFQHN